MTISTIAKRILAASANTPKMAGILGGARVSVQFASEEGQPDLLPEFTAYLNSHFRGQEDMEQRIGVHAMDFAEAHDLYVDVKPDVITFWPKKYGLSFSRKFV